MNVWSSYKARMEAIGADARSGASHRLTGRLIAGVPSSLSYQNAIIDGEPRSLAIIDSDDLTRKTLCSLPGETLPHGGYVDWSDTHWLITECDAKTVPYAKAIMYRCNYLLKWVSDNGDLVERWSIVEDGTKYLTGEFGDTHYVVTRGDSRIALTLPRDPETCKLGRNNRFIIDDPDSPNPMAYILTKPFKVGSTYDGKGVFKFVLQEAATEDSDNLEKDIPNYYESFPDEKPQDVIISPPAVAEGKKVWI